MSGIRGLLFDASRLAGGSAESGSADGQRTFLLETLVSIGRSDLVEPMTAFLDGGEDAGAYMSKTDDLVAIDELFGVSVLGSEDD